jgi:hypothetical protein
MIEYEENMHQLEAPLKGNDNIVKILKVMKEKSFPGQ